MAVMKSIYSEVSEMYFEGVSTALIAVRLELPLELVQEIVADAEAYEMAVDSHFDFEATAEY